MSKHTIKFQPVHSEAPSKKKAKFKPKGFRKPTKDLALKIFVDNLPVGFIRVNPSITIFMKGVQLPGKITSMSLAKAKVINYVTEKFKK